MFKRGDYVKHVEGGQRLRVLDLRPVGLSVIVVTEDCTTGAVAHYWSARLRPWVNGTAQLEEPDRC